MIYSQPGFLDAGDAADFDSGNRHDWCLVLGLWPWSRINFSFTPSFSLGISAAVWFRNRFNGFRTRHLILGGKDPLQK